jgi:hypothetical protein
VKLVNVATAIIANFFSEMAKSLSNQAWPTLFNLGTYLVTYSSSCISCHSSAHTLMVLCWQRIKMADLLCNSMFKYKSLYPSVPFMDLLSTLSAVPLWSREWKVKVNKKVHSPVQCTTGLYIYHFWLNITICKYYCSFPITVRSN